MPGRPVLAGGLGHDRGAALLPADEHVDAAVAQGIEDREVALAGHAGDPLDALDEQLIDEHLRAGAWGQSAQAVSPWRCAAWRMSPGAADRPVAALNLTAAVSWDATDISVPG